MATRLIQITDEKMVSAAREGELKAFMKALQNGANAFCDSFKGAHPENSSKLCAAILQSLHPHIITRFLLWICSAPENILFVHTLTLSDKEWKILYVFAMDSKKHEIVEYDWSKTTNFDHREFIELCIGSNYKLPDVLAILLQQINRNVDKQKFHDLIVYSFELLGGFNRDAATLFCLIRASPPEFNLEELLNHAILHRIKSIIIEIVKKSRFSPNEIMLRSSEYLYEEGIELMVTQGADNFDECIARIKEILSSDAYQRCVRAYNGIIKFLESQKKRR